MYKVAFVKNSCQFFHVFGKGIDKKCHNQILLQVCNFEEVYITLYYSYLYLVDTTDSYRYTCSLTQVMNFINYQT